MAELFDPQRDIDVLKRGAFGEGVAATAAIGEQYARATEALRTERILEAQRKQQSIAKAEREAQAARAQAENERRIQEQLPVFLGQVQDVAAAAKTSPADRLKAITDLRVANPFIANEPAAKAVVDSYTSSLKGQIKERKEASKERKEGKAELTKTKVQGLIAKGDLKTARESVKQVKDEKQRQSLLNEIQKARRGKVTSKVEAEKELFDAMVATAGSSLDDMFKLTEEAGQAEAGLDPDMVAATAEPSTGRASVTKQLLNKAKSDYISLFGREEADKVFSGADVGDPESILATIETARDKIETLRARARKTPNKFFRKEWDPKRLPEIRPAPGAPTASPGGGGGFN